MKDEGVIKGFGGQHKTKVDRGMGMSKKKKKKMSQ